MTLPDAAPPVIVVTVKCGTVVRVGDILVAGVNSVSVVICIHYDQKLPERPQENEYKYILNDKK